MKKALTIGILLLFFGMNTIRIVNVHYCHGILESVNFSLPDEDCCEHPHEDHTGCCQDITVEVDLDSEYLLSEQPETGMNTELFALIGEFRADFDFAADLISKSRLSLNEKPPSEPRYLLTHSFLFYG
ncbi:MAG: hypothetical protein JW801_03780 [Bacteroidales bacterium]|nr:hypothetical protein [Bacteroidales bacterium]